MIRIDNISFEFTTPDEKFAHELYVGWDVFCRHCFEQVVEECLSTYNKEKVLYEIEQLELDLGSIPEEYFYREFPRRLKEVLLKALPTGGLQRKSETEENGGSRLDNLLFYLEYGYPKAEWADEDFSLSEELGWLLSHSAPEQYIIRIASLCLEKEHVFHRLLWQADNAEVLLRIYAASLSEPSAGLHGKHRFLTRLLETRPGIPVRFIHEATDDASLGEMAELLDSVSVKQIMVTEAEEHAEVDLPPYWHYLYEWLIRYYPYNGIAMFGGKAEFTNHLHHRLLIFIRKRNYSFYLSKAELTVSFLLEVFGPTYYIDVLNTIYYLQPYRADGSPTHDGYFSQELYRIFLQLSLLHQPAVTKENTLSVEDKASSGLKDPTDIMDILQDAKCSDADKRMFIRTIVKEQPEILIQWLRLGITPNMTGITIVAALIEVDTMNCMLAALSFNTLQAVEVMRNYLRQQYSEESDWLKGITETQLELLLRQSVLMWIRKGYYRLPNRFDQLLNLFYQELTGKEDEAIVTRLSASQPLKEIKEGLGLEQSGRWSIQRLQEILSVSVVTDDIKRKLLVCFLEQSSKDYAEAVRQLHACGLSNSLCRLINQPIWEEVLRQSTVRLVGLENTALLLSLFDGLMAHERALSSYWKGGSKPLKARLLVWLVETIRLQETHKKPVVEYIRSLFADLVGREEISEVILALWREMGHMDSPATEEILHLLVDNESRQIRLMKTDYKEWLRQAENDYNAVQMLFKSRWNTADGFIEWLDDTSIPYENKSGLLRHTITEQPAKWIHLLRDLPHESQYITAIAGYVPAPLMLHGMVKTDFYQTSVLSQLMEQLQHQEEELSRIIGSSLSLPLALSKALLLYLQDRDTSGRTLTANEIAGKFLAFFYFIQTGKTDYHNNILWISFTNKIISNMSSSENNMASDDINKILSNASNNDATFQQSVNFLIDQQPEKLLTWLEKDANQPEIERIVLVSDRIMAKRWTVCLSATAGFEQAGVFQRLTSWFLDDPSDRISVTGFIRALLSWVKETDWKRQTPDEMEAFFFSRLFGKSKISLPLEKIADNDLPEDTRKRWLRNYMRFQPEELLKYIQKTVSQNMLPPDKWIAWLDIEDWLRLAASLSLSGAELFRQILEHLSKRNTFQKSELRQALATYIIKSRTDEWIYGSPEETVRSWVQSLPEKKEVVKEKLLLQLCETLQLSKDGRVGTDEATETPEFLLVENAGLCLLAPWLSRLFAILSYLDDERKSLKNTALKIRAVFLLQYIVYGEEREYQETELAFNRLLVGLPLHIPIPKQLPLTSEEKQTVDSMVAGIKANWPSMDGTSVRGFRQSFIARSGTLEQQEERWLLTMVEKTHDILLESVPWSFRQIRFPWLKKYVQVMWHEKQKFQ